MHVRDVTRATVITLTRGRQLAGDMDLLPVGRRVSPIDRFERPLRVDARGEIGVIPGAINAQFEPGKRTI